MVWGKLSSRRAPVSSLLGRGAASIPSILRLPFLPKFIFPYFGEAHPLTVFSERVRVKNGQDCLQTIGGLQLPQTHPSSLRASWKTPHHLGYSDLDSESVKVDSPRKLGGSRIEPGRTSASPGALRKPFGRGKQKCLRPWVQAQIRGCVSNADATRILRLRTWTLVLGDGAPIVMF